MQVLEHPIQTLWRETQDLELAAHSLAVDMDYVLMENVNAMMVMKVVIAWAWSTTYVIMDALGMDDVSLEGVVNVILVGLAEFVHS